MKRMKLGVAVLLCGAAGCITSGSNMDSIRSRHGAEFECPESDVEISEIEWSTNRAKGTYLAKGCDTKAIYVCEMGTCIRNSR